MVSKRDVFIQDDNENFRNIISSKEKCLDYLIKYGVIGIDNMCYNCEEIMVKMYDSSLQLLGVRYRCPRCLNKKSILAFSMYENSNLSLLEMFLIIFYCFREDMNSEKALTSIKSMVNVNMNEKTLDKYYKELRKKITIYMQNVSNYKLGGNNRCVCIDESQFGNYWILGIIEVRSRELRMLILRDRSSPVIIPLILENVHLNTTIITDGWPSYISLEENGFNHEEHIHGQNDWGFGEESTSHIESSWSYVKRWFISAYNTFPDLNSDLELFISECLFKRRIRLEKLNYSLEIAKLINL